MRSRLFRTLMLASCCVLVPPPGWCCVLGAGECCELPARAEKPSDDDASECCCCQEKRAPQSKSQPAKPAPPAKSPCCEWQPTTLVKPEKTFPGTLFVALVQIPDSETIVFTRTDTPAPQWTAARSLQVLHCSWLC